MHRSVNCWIVITVLLDVVENEVNEAMYGWHIPHIHNKFKVWTHSAKITVKYCSTTKHCLATKCCLTLKHCSTMKCCSNLKYCSTMKCCSTMKHCSTMKCCSTMQSFKFFLQINYKIVLSDEHRSIIINFYALKSLISLFQTCKKFCDEGVICVIHLNFW